MNIANKISLFRILTVPFFIASLAYSSEKPFLKVVAVAIFILAVISDAVDGYIARKAKQISKAGAVLDPLGDKLLLMSAFICLSIVNQIPLWVSLIIISRDAIILIGTLVIYMVKQNIDIYPSVWGKLTTTFQMLAVIIVLVYRQISFGFIILAVVFTVISGVVYIRRGFKVLYALDNSRNIH